MLKKCLIRQTKQQEYDEVLRPGGGPGETERGSRGGGRWEVAEEANSKSGRIWGLRTG